MEIKQTEIIKIETSQGEVELSPLIVRKYLVSGGGNITDQEVQMFLMLCKYQRLNPFLREAYLVKYGTGAATIITGKETFLKRAARCEKYRGHEVGLKVWNNEEKIAFAKVHVEGYVVPIMVEVNYKEYVGRKGDGTINRMWTEKPETMLKKVALVQALREAFPEEFGGMYSPEEINTVQIDMLPTNIVDIKEEKNISEIDYGERITALMEITGITTDGMKELAIKNSWKSNKSTEGLKERYEYLKQVADNMTADQNLTPEAPGTTTPENTVIDTPKGEYLPPTPTSDKNQRIVLTNKDIDELKSDCAKYKVSEKTLLDSYTVDDWEGIVDTKQKVKNKIAVLSTKK